MDHSVGLIWWIRIDGLGPLLWIADRYPDRVCWILIVGGFYSEVALQKREAEGTVRTKHQLNLDPNPEGTQKNLDDRRYGGREEQRIPHVGGGAGAAQGVTGHLRALGDRTSCT